MGASIWVINVIEVGYTPTKKSHVTNKQYIDESIKDHTLFSRIWHYSTISSTTKYPMAQRSGWTDGAHLL